MQGSNPLGVQGFERQVVGCLFTLAAAFGCPGPPTRRDGVALILHRHEEKSKAKKAHAEMCELKKKKKKKKKRKINK